MLTAQAALVTSLSGLMRLKSCAHSPWRQWLHHRLVNVADALYSQHWLHHRLVNVADALYSQRTVALVTSLSG